MEGKKEKKEARKYAISLDEAAIVESEPYRFIPEFIRKDELSKLVTTRKRRFGGIGFLEYLKTTGVIPTVLLLLVYPFLVYQSYYSHYISSTVNVLNDNVLQIPFFFYFGIAGLFFIATAMLNSTDEEGVVSRIAKILFPSILFLTPFFILSEQFIRTGFWFIPVFTYVFFFIVHLIPLSDKRSGMKYEFGDSRIGWQKHSASLDDSLVRSWGEAGGHIGENTQFGVKAEIGAVGERRTGEVLSTLSTVFPHVRVFHGLCFTPGRKGADVDHAVLVNDRLILIDSKNWKYDNYSWFENDNGVSVIARDRKQWEPGEIKMGNAVKNWQNYMGNRITVESLICLANTDSEKYIINNLGSPANMKMVTLNSLLDYIHNIADTKDRVVDRVALKKIVTQLQ